MQGEETLEPLVEYEVLYGVYMNNRDPRTIDRCKFSEE